MVSVPSRHCFNWTIAENLRLEREYDLLELDVNAIAKMHGRSVHAIVHQLQAEDMISRFADARGYEMSSAQVADQADDDSDSEYEFEEECDDEDDDEDAIDEDYEALVEMNTRLQRRVAQLETTISLMKKAKSAPKRLPLRKRFM
jgi:TATA-binding protein-associated factor Taf7